jgi:hypothetical protein
MIMGFTKPIEHLNLTTKEGDFMNPLYVGIDVSSVSDSKQGVYKKEFQCGTIIQLPEFLFNSFI